MGTFFAHFTEKLTYGSSTGGTKISGENVREAYRHCRPPITGQEMIAMAGPLGLAPVIQAMFLNMGADIWITFSYSGQFGYDFRDLDEVDEFYDSGEQSILRTVETYNYDTHTRAKGFGFGMEPLFFTKTCDYLAYVQKKNNLIVCIHRMVV